jgi:protein-S-isoprenylcysteine O-methyltransferase Ste14
MSQWAVDINGTGCNRVHKKNLKTRAAWRLVITLAVLALLCFLPAGSARFWQAWMFLGVMAIFWTYSFIVLLREHPQLLERRMRSKEPEPAQRVLLKIFSVLLYAGFVIAGLDFRFGWSRMRLGGVPTGFVVAGQMAAAIGYWLVFRVMKANSFAGSTIEVENGQAVIQTGPYVLVRHPMYLGMVITALAVPFALGSYAALPAFALIVPVLVLRLIHEEKTLHRELAGYAEYCERTQFRLVPWIW